MINQSVKSLLCYWGDHVNSVPDLAASPPWFQPKRLKRRHLKNAGLNGNRTHDLCDTGAEVAEVMGSIPVQA